MSGFDYDNFSDGEWDNHEDLAWNEFDWQQYLKQNDKEIAQFLAHYHQLKGRPEHLDEVARLMGWDREDWAPGEDEDDDDAAEPIAAEDAQKRRESEEDGYDPYTVHRHPVFVVTHGLFQHLNNCLEQYAAQQGSGFSAVSACRIGNSLGLGEFNAIMAVNALDMADYNLAVCHLKNALSGLNVTMRLLQQLPAGGNSRLHSLFMSESLSTLFDLREVWLRVMNDCREESRRRRDGESE